MNRTELKGFLQGKGATRPNSTTPRVYLAAFGKHPGWNDHIDDLGFETQTLVTAKRFLYLDGISSQIDQGVWERLDQASRHAVFDHSFLWQRGEEVLLGLIRDSRDGKGRTHYPMVLCLHTLGLPARRVVADLGPVLDSAMAECLAVATAAEVEAVLDRVRTMLRERVSTPVTEPASPPTRAALPDHPGLGPDNLGLFRILYQVRNQFGGWAPGRIDFSGTGALPRAAHLRAPQLFATMAEGAPVWLDFFRAQVDREAPVLLLWPRSASWVDVIVGPPEGADLFALKANAKAMPLANEVPYQIDPDFRHEAETLFEEFSRGSAATRNIFAADPTASGRTAFMPHLRPTRLAKFMLGTGHKLKLWLKSKPKKFVGGAVGLMAGLVLGISALVYWGTRPAEETPARGPVATVGRAAELDEATREAWRLLCLAHFEWVGRLQSELSLPEREKRWRADPGLRMGVLESLERKGRPLQELSPQKLAGVTGASNALASNPPSSLARPEVRRRVAEAAAAVDEIGKAILGWEQLRSVAALAKAMGERGWRGAAADLGKLPDAVRLDSNLASSIDLLLARHTEIDALAGQLKSLNEDWERLAQSSDPFLVEWVSAARHDAAQAADLAQLAAVFEKRNYRIREVISLISPENHPDWEPMRTASREIVDQGSVDRPQIDAWVAKARGFLPVPDQERPFRDDSWRTEKAALETQIRQLLRLRPDGVSDDLQRKFDSLASRFAELKGRRVLRVNLDGFKRDVEQFDAAQRTLADDVRREIVRRSDPAKWLADVRAISIAGSRRVSDEWSRRRDAFLSRVGPDPPKVEQLLELQSQLERTERFLENAASSDALPRALPASAAVSDALAEDINAEIERQREGVLNGLLKLAGWKDEVTEQAWADFVREPAVSRLIDDHQNVVTTLMTLAQRAEALNLKLEAGASVRELSEEEKNLALDSLKPPSDSMAGRLLHRLEALKKLSVVKDGAQAIHAAKEPDLVVALAAWRALGQLADWPVTPGELREEENLEASLRLRIVRDVKPPDKRELLWAEVSSDGARRWRRFLSAARFDADLEVAFGSIRTFGLVSTQLTGRDRYNEWLFRLKQIRWIDMPGDSLARTRAATLAELNSFLDSRDPLRNQPWLVEFQRIKIGGNNVDYSKLGPGGAGWRLAASSTPQLLRFEWEIPGRTTHYFDFRQIVSAGSKSCYMSTSEFPVQLFIDWVDQKGLGSSIASTIKDLVDEIAAGSDPRLGPRVFELTKDRRFVLAKSWIKRNEDYYRSGRAPGKPESGSPLNYITTETARTLATSFKCRLPTENEWKRALEMDSSEKADESAKCNRRDKTWFDQFEHVSRLPAGKEKLWPNAEAFTPPSVFVVNPLEKPAVDYDDGVLWFVPVGSGAGRLFKNLIGNVAEFVSLEASSGIGVIGGSALSGPLVEITKPYPALGRSYSDVGFRLAFSADRSPSFSFTELVSSAGYRW